jgi:hypothetical protein
MVGIVRFIFHAGVRTDTGKVDVLNVDANRYYACAYRRKIYEAIPFFKNNEFDYANCCLDRGRI